MRKISHCYSGDNNCERCLFSPYPTVYVEYKLIYSTFCLHFGVYARFNGINFFLIQSPTLNRSRVDFNVKLIFIIFTCVYHIEPFSFEKGFLKSNIPLGGSTYIYASGKTNLGVSTSATSLPLSVCGTWDYLILAKCRIYAKPEKI